MEYWSIALCIVISALSIHLFKNLNYFKRHGMMYEPHFPRMCHVLQLMFRRISLADIVEKLYYFQPESKYLGFYVAMTPMILLRDPDLIKEILVKSFNAFPLRRFSELNDPLFARSLFSLKDQKWRQVRNLLSSVFTSSKMKTMFALMSECAADFIAFMSTLPAEKRDVDMKDAFARYASDVMATCAFGIKVDSIRNPSNQFYLHAKAVVNFPKIRSIKMIFMRIFPSLGRIFNLKFIDDHVLNFFKYIMKTTIATRDAENISRPDMIQMMMDIRGKHEATIELDIDDMLAHVFFFFFAGFETNSTMLCFIAHEIAANPDVQARLRQEIDMILEESNCRVTYDTIDRLEYLSTVIYEALRFYATIFLERICETAFALPSTLSGEKSFVIKKGMIVCVPVFAIHRDQKYYDEPMKFRPERFLNDKTLRNAPYYLPFGAGPRKCIASRFAVMEMKVLLFYLLATCELRPCSRTTLPMRLKNSMHLTAENGFWLNIEPRNEVHPTIRDQIRT